MPNRIPCPNCHYCTLSFAKRRKTYLCSSCGYEAEDPDPKPDTKATQEVIFQILGAGNYDSRGICANDRETITYFIRQLLEGGKQSHLVHLVWDCDSASAKAGLPEGVRVDGRKGTWCHSGHEYKIGQCRYGPHPEEGDLIGVFDISDPKQLSEIVSIGQRILKEQRWQQENPLDPWAKMRDDE